MQPTAQEQERIAKLEEEKLLQQRKIQQLESMILVSKSKGQEVTMSEKRKVSEISESLFYPPFLFFYCSGLNLWDGLVADNVKFIWKRKI